MRERWLYIFACSISAMLLSCLASQRIEIAIMGPLISFPCIVAVLIGVLAFGFYAVQFGRAIDGRFVLPKNNWIRSLTRIWIACLIVAFAAGIPSILYFESVVRKYQSNDEQERIGPVVPRAPSI